MGKTLFEKIWKNHVVDALGADMDVIYIDKHYIHEVTSPQAFESIQKADRQIFRPQNIVATVDHNVPTKNQDLPIKDALSKKQVEQLISNCEENNIPLYGLGHPYQGIVHVIGPELGHTQPGMTIVCGDSHTSTHGAFGAIAFGIGTSEIEQVFATQSLIQKKPKMMRLNISGNLQKGVSAKDLILFIISKMSSSGGNGYFLEYAGEAISNMSMEERMTICNMSIEMGARGGLIAPDNTTIAYLENKPFANLNKEKLDYWNTLFSDKDASFDAEHHFNASEIEPMISFGTSIDASINITGNIPANENSIKKSLEYMGFEPNEKLLGKTVNYVFIGSCTNARIEDLRVVADFVKGKRKAENINALIVPGSRQVLEQAKQENIDTILEEAGFELREPGCSACLAMNEDKIPAGEYCISTSNRNFEGRQGPGARTLLASPLTAAATAINGYITDVREALN